MKTMNTDMLVGAGFALGTVTEDSAQVTIGTNTGVITMSDPDHDPIGKCALNVNGESRTFDSIYEAADFLEFMGCDEHEIFVSYSRFLVLNVLDRTIRYTSDAIEDCEDFIHDQMNPPEEPEDGMLHYEIIDMSPEEQIRRVKVFVKDFGDDDEE